MIKRNNTILDAVESKIKRNCKWGANEIGSSINDKDICCCSCGVQDKCITVCSKSNIKCYKCSYDS